MYLVQRRRDSEVVCGKILIFPSDAADDSGIGITGCRAKAPVPKAS